jgi:hypothetical protein
MSLVQQPARINAAGYQIPGNVAAAVQQASARSGASFSYLMAQAAQESSFKPDARASTSSATGLYQFVEGTWLQMVREHGRKYGAGQLADQISPDPAGGFKVADAATRREILALRNDPKMSAAMAAEYAVANKSQLEQKSKGPVGSTDLYLAHFLGPSGASRFLAGMREDSQQPAEDLFPEAAAANPSVFYDRSGQPLSLQQIYDRFQKKIAGREAEFGQVHAQAVAVARAEDPMAPIRSVPSFRGSRDPISPLSMMVLTTLSDKLPEISVAQVRHTDDAARRRQAELQRSLIG